MFRSLTRVPNLAAASPVSASRATPEALSLSIQRAAMSTTPSLSSAAPKKPSPYRLFTPTTFLASFADLHVAGWRLLPLSKASLSSEISQATGDLQDRRLVKVYEFQADQAERSWRGDLNKLVQNIIKHGADTRVSFTSNSYISINVSTTPLSSSRPRVIIPPHHRKNWQMIRHTFWKFRLILTLHYRPLASQRTARKCAQESL